MKRFLLSLLMPLFIMSCFETETTSTPEEDELDSFRLKSRVGDTLAYRRYFLSLPSLKDTIKSFSLWVITKDTIINGTNHFIYEGIEYNESYQKLDTVTRRMLVKHDNSEVECWDFNLNHIGNELPNGPLRSTKSFKTMTYREIVATLTGKVGLLPRHIDSNDTFQDYTYPLVYPLAEDKEWHFRKPGSQWNHSEYFKKCHGFDTIKHNGIVTPVVKTEMLVDKSLDLGYNIPNSHWYDTLGIFRAEWDYGEMSDLETGETFYSSEEFQRIDPAEIDVRILKPYGIQYDTLKTTFATETEFVEVGLCQKLLQTTTEDSISKVVDAYIIDTYNKYNKVKNHLDTTVQSLAPSYFDTTYLAVFPFSRFGGDSLVAHSHFVHSDTLSVPLRTAEWYSEDGVFPTLALHYQLTFAVKK